MTSSSILLKKISTKFLKLSMLGKTYVEIFFTEKYMKVLKFHANKRKFHDENSKAFSGKNMKKHCQFVLC